MAELYPPSYSEATRQHAADSGFLTCQDFVPYVLSAGGLFSNPKYEPFSVLIERANEWLAKNRTMEVKTCESVEFKISNFQSADHEKMTYYEYGENRTYYIRGLRLWLHQRNDISRPPQKICYMNLTPQKYGTGKHNYETLNQLISQFNQTLRNKLLPGRILTVESQEMKLSHYSEFDPDRSFWSEHGDYARNFMFVIRIFYEECQPAFEEIGIVDFIPQILQAGGIFSYPIYEPFSKVIESASHWCTQQAFLRFCHAQSVEIKIKSDGLIDTQRMHYTEHGNRNTRYVRILRIAYAYPTNTRQVQISCPPPLKLTCKTFIPRQLTGGMLANHKYERMSNLKHTIQIWVQATGARVLSAETAAMRLRTGGEAYQGVEASYTYNSGQQSEYWIKVVRLYLDGEYNDPPPHILAPQPQHLRQKSENCCIS